jgi:hypothetical protein
MKIGVTSTARWRAFARLVAFVAAIGMPVPAHAQEAALSGTITDSTAGVLPGVTVTAVHTGTGNTFVGVTDEGGVFRLPVRVGDYRVSAELSGFNTVTRTLSLLVGQTAVVNVQMSTAGIEESVTVSGQAPLIDATNSSVGKAIDSRQVSDLPVNGRNWVDLAMLAPGSRLNASTDEPGTLVGTVGVGTFQLNVDGLRVTQNQTSGFGQPKYSKDAIAEFEFVSSRFDATQGGSMGVQVNAITKSGTNSLSGSFASYFRDDSLVGKDFVQNRVLQYSDQQFSWTLGGPIRRDRMHFFVNYEYERQPQTISYSSAFPTFNIDQIDTITEKKGGVRLDLQFSPKNRLSVRGNGSERWEPYDARYTGGASKHPSSAIQSSRHSNDLGITLTQVLGANTFNEIQGGYVGFYWILDSKIPWANHPYGLPTGTPILQMRSYTIGQGHGFTHEFEDVENYTIKDNLTFSRNKWGRHNLKLGGIYTYQANPVFLCNRCMGSFDMQGGPVPANIEQLFPVWNDISTWNLNALAPITRSYTLGVGKMDANAMTNSASAWLQDDWQIGSKLTLNLGVRYDLTAGTYAEDIAIEPFLPAGRRHDTDNVGPRVGATYALTERTIVRGGFGKYFADIGANRAYWTNLVANALFVNILNDGRPDFVTNPFNGPVPTFDEVATRLCSVSNRPGCLRRSLSNTLAAPENEIPFSYQSSVGVQRQLTNTMAVEADYVYTGMRKLLVAINRNMAYNPATGANYAFTDLAHLPYPEWSTVSQQYNIGASDYHALQLGFTKRLSSRWQGSATFLYSRQYDLQNAPILPGCNYVATLGPQGGPVCDVPVTLTPDLAEEWYLTPDQQKRATLNGIWDLWYGLQFSGKYLYGDNGWATPSSGVDVRQTGNSGGRLKADGTLIPRNSFDKPSMHKFDIRMQRRFDIGRAKIEGIVEMFNVFNHKNVNAFTTNLSSARYGEPSGDTNIDYQPRMMQFAFRISY